MTERGDVISTRGSDQVDAASGDEDEVDARGQQASGGAPSSVMSLADFVSENYPMNHGKRGTAVIINNENFDPKLHLKERGGTSFDVSKVYGVLNMLGFEKIRELNDEPVKKLTSTLKEVAKQDHKDSDCFICVILSHGEEGYIYGYDDKVSIDDLILPFKGNNCPSLAGKPKIFIIQACKEFDDTVCDAGPEGAESDTIVVETRRIPREADFLMAYSVVPGNLSWANNPGSGSWFIEAIHDVFTDHWDKLDLMTLLTRVNRKVARDFSTKAPRKFNERRQQIPCITSMLTKNVFFTDKNKP